MTDDVNNRSLTIKDIQEVLIPAMERVFATKKDLENFATKEDLQIFEQRAMETFASKKDLQSFEQTVIENFASKQDLKDFGTIIRKEMAEKFDKVLTRSDKILKDLEILMTEKVISDYQKQKERKLWTIMIDALKKHNILSPVQLKEIDDLEVF